MKASLERGESDGLEGGAPEAEHVVCGGDARVERVPGLNVASAILVIPEDGKIGGAHCEKGLDWSLACSIN